MSTTEKDVLPFLDSRIKLETVENILRGKDRIEAYKLAGGKSKSTKATSVIVSKWLKQANVKKYVSMREEELNLRTKAKTEIDRDWVIANYKEVYDRCMQKVPVTDAFGNQRTQLVDQGGGMMKPEGVWAFNYKGSLGALDGISRVMGFNAPLKVDATLKYHRVKELADLDKKELVKLAEMETLDERRN